MCDNAVLNETLPCTVAEEEKDEEPESDSVSVSLRPAAAPRQWKPKLGSPSSFHFEV